MVPAAMPSPSASPAGVDGFAEAAGLVNFPVDADGPLAGTLVRAQRHDGHFVGEQAVVNYLQGDLTGGH